MSAMRKSDECVCVSSKLDPPSFGNITLLDDMVFLDYNNLSYPYVLFCAVVVSLPSKKILSQQFSCRFWKKNMSIKNCSYISVIISAFIKKSSKIYCQVLKLSRWCHLHPQTFKVIFTGP